MKNWSDFVVTISLFLCVTLVFAMLPCIEAQQTGEERWYHYSIEGKQIGYARVSYQNKQDEGVCYKKKLKFRKIGENTEIEEISAVLAQDYSLRSAYISVKENQKQTFIIITAGENIIIQNEKDIVVLEKQKFYLEAEDFLRAIVLTEKLKYGSYYHGMVLSTDRKRLAKISVRYLGKETSLSFFREIECHTLKLTTAELKNFWADVKLDKEGEIVGYQIGTFHVLHTSPENALAIARPQSSLAVPFVADTGSLQRVYLQFQCSIPNLFRTGAYQTVKNDRIILKACFPPAASPSLQEISQQSQYLKLSENPPAPILLNFAQQAGGGTRDPIRIVQNIAAWVHQHTVSTSSPIGQKLRNFYGMSRETPSLSIVTLCRLNNIPARAVAGLHYYSGRFVYATWAEAYLGEWIPIYKGSVGYGACFLSLWQDKTLSQITEFPEISLTLERVKSKNRDIRFDNAQSFLKVEGDTIHDYLLGISVVRPPDWVVLSKDTSSDMLILRSLKGQGPAILLQVFELPKSLDEILETLGQKIGTDSGIEVLWKQDRSFEGGKALEIALQSKTATKMIYRAFIAEAKEQGVLALLIVPLSELTTVEKGFQSLISSLRFIR